MLPTTHYEHSGHAPFGGVLLTLIGGAIAGALLGALYGFLIYWIPFIYINAFIALGFGFVMALVVGGLGKIGKIRNIAVVTVLALLVSLVAYYAHWAVWVSLMAETQVVEPGVLWSFILTINEFGPWSIFGWTPTGVALWGIWGIEAVIILGIGTLSAHGVIDIPFCETTGQWTNETPVATHFKPIEAHTNVESPQSLLQALQPLTEPLNNYVEAVVSTADGSELRCVSLSDVTVEVDKDGKEQTQKKDVVRHMLLDRTSFDQLMRFAEPAAG